MITKDNQTLYSSLFTKANQLLNLSGEDQIRTIDDYFCHLGDIADLVVADDGTVSDPLYFILPVDEPTFKINANTRQIEVPTEFKHGVSVKGDEIAETIYFVIDRYFDTTDFYDKNIKAIVQWENAGGQNISHTTAKAVIEDVSDTSKENPIPPVKVIFGWPLTSEITEYAGNVTFSVRFYNTFVDDEGVEHLEYSFSTLNQTIKINPSLDLDVIEGGFETVDKNWLIYKRLRNSLPADINLQAIQPIIDYFSPAANSEADLDNNGKLVIKMKSTYPSGTNASRIKIQKFTIMRDDYEGTHTIVSAGINDVDEKGNKIFGEDYIPTNDNSMNTTETYYYEDGGVYTPYTDPDWPTGNVQLYEKVYTYTVDTAGQYYVIATNYLGESNYATNTSGKFEVKLPTKPIISADSAASYYGVLIENTDDDGVGLGTYIPCKLKLNATDTDAGTPLTFNWYKASLVDGAKTPVQEGISLPEYDATTEGYYFLEAVNKRNNAQATTMSDPIRITLPAEAPTLSYFAFKYEISGESLQADGIAPNLKLTIVPSSNRADEYEYHWYRVDDAEGNKPQLIGNDSSFTFSETQVGNYYMCTVTSVFNTISKASTNSVIFKVASI